MVEPTCLDRIERLPRRLATTWDRYLLICRPIGFPRDEFLLLGHDLLRNQENVDGDILQGFMSEQARLAEKPEEPTQLTESEWHAALSLSEVCDDVLLIGVRAGKLRWILLGDEESVYSFATHAADLIRRHGLST